jgi:hypothetical protein
MIENPCVGSSILPRATMECKAYSLIQISKNCGSWVIYQTKLGSLELKADIHHETIWLTQQQVAELFDVQKAAISKHVGNIFTSEELDQKATVSKMGTVRNEGGRPIKRMSRMRLILDRERF